MTALGHIRGHLAYWDGSTWRYNDNGEPATAERPCIECKLVSTGPDPCIGWLPGVSSACCGHGVHDPYVVASSDAGADQ